MVALDSLGSQNLPTVLIWIQSENPTSNDGAIPYQVDSFPD